MPHLPIIRLELPASPALRHMHTDEIRLALARLAALVKNVAPHAAYVCISCQKHPPRHWSWAVPSKAQRSVRCRVPVRMSHTHKRHAMQCNASPRLHPTTFSQFCRLARENTQSCMADSSNAISRLWAKKKSIARSLEGDTSPDSRGNAWLGRQKT